METHLILLTLIFYYIIIHFIINIELASTCGNPTARLATKPKAFPPLPTPSPPLLSLLPPSSSSVHGGSVLSFRNMLKTCLKSVIATQAVKLCNLHGTG